MNPIKRLISEHETIIDALQVLSKICDASATACQIANPAHADQLVAFFRLYADAWHHGKEEDQLFPALEQIGISREGGPIGVMLIEHDQGREFVRGMGQSLTTFKDDSDKGTTDFIRYSRGFIQLLTQHIDKENKVLFTMAEKHLPKSTLNELEVLFDQKASTDASTDIKKICEAVELLKTIYGI
ncbi:hemerythrin domain-containing protein [bacterium]|nr:hemerythrin domain-containing protein [bacterium]